MNPGDVIWVEFPAGAGRAQAGRRPAVIAQVEHVSRQIPTTPVIPLTTQQEALRFPGTVFITPDDQNGLKYPSVALVFQIAAIDRKFFGTRLGTVSADIVESIWTGLKEITGRADWPDSAV